MCGSTKHGKFDIKQWFDRQDDIHHIVDVGCGCGTYPKLLGKNAYKWTGIEIWAPYIDKFGLNDLYDTVIIADVRYIRWPSADCVIFGDVLEHMEKSVAKKVLRNASSVYEHIVVSIPISDTEKYESRAHHGNVYNKHLSYWTYDEVQSLLNWAFEYREKNIAVFAK